MTAERSNSKLVAEVLTAAAEKGEPPPTMYEISQRTGLTYSLVVSTVLKGLADRSLGLVVNQDGREDRSQHTAHSRA